MVQGSQAPGDGLGRCRVSVVPIRCVICRQRTLCEYCQGPAPTAVDVGTALALFDDRWHRYFITHGGTQYRNGTLAHFVHDAADDEAIELLESAIDLVRVNRDRWEALSKRLAKLEY
jgi:hypothetical protein